MKISKNKNKNKVIAVVGIIIFVLLLILGVLFVINRPKEEAKETEKDVESNLVEENPEKTEESDEKSDGETEDNKVEENKPEEKNEDEKTGKNQSNNNNSKDIKDNKDNKNSKPATNTNSNSNSNSSSSSTVTPEPTYSCPNGYQLNGTKCVETINAQYGCPSGMNESVNNMCINFDEGYEVSKEHNCPSGETMIHMIGFMGTADKYECYPLHKKEYSCPNGYILGGGKCTKTINATKK